MQILDLFFKQPIRILLRLDFAFQLHNLHFCMIKSFFEFSHTSINVSTSTGTIISQLPIRISEVITHTTSSDFRCSSFFSDLPRPF
jgi:hypothetical protein